MVDKELVDLAVLLNQFSLQVIIDFTLKPVTSNAHHMVYSEVPGM